MRAGEERERRKTIDDCRTGRDNDIMNTIHNNNNNNMMMMMMMVKQRRAVVA